MKNITPFLSSPGLKTLALEKLRRIGDSLSGDIASFDPKAPNDTISLMGGVTGKVLFLLHYYRFCKEEKYLEHALAGIEKILDYAGESQFTFYTFCDGLAGVGALLRHTAQYFPEVEIDADSLLEEVDPYLDYKMYESIEMKAFDYLHGSLGIFLYFLKKYKPDSSLNHHYDEYFQKLLSISCTPDQGGLAWKGFVADPVDELNLGLAHGNPSILAILAKAYKVGALNEPKHRDAIRRSCDFMLACQLKGTHSLFPFSIKTTEEPVPARLAWCYGDLGVALSLWHAAQALQSSELEQEVHRILAFNTGRRDLKENWVDDAGFCHGAIGIAHIFNRFYRWTSRPEYALSAQYWYETGLNMAYHPDEPTGFKTFGRGAKEWTSCGSLLEGTAGMGLGLLSALYTGEPVWDEFFLVSV